MEEIIVIIIASLLILAVVFVAYKLAKIPGKLTIETLALCLIAIALNLIILKTLAVCYLIFKLFWFGKKYSKNEKNEKGNES